MPVKPRRSSPFRAIRQHVELANWMAARLQGLGAEAAEAGMTEQADEYYALSHALLGSARARLNKSTKEILLDLCDEIVERSARSAFPFALGVVKSLRADVLARG